jgi:hypothetical protein
MQLTNILSVSEGVGPVLATDFPVKNKQKTMTISLTERTQKKNKAARTKQTWVVRNLLHHHHKTLTCLVAKHINLIILIKVGVSHTNRQQPFISTRFET